MKIGSIALDGIEARGDIELVNGRLMCDGNDVTPAGEGTVIDRLEAIEICCCIWGRGGARNNPWALRLTRSARRTALNKGWLR